MTVALVRRRGFRRVLKLLETTMIGLGSTIGASIFVLSGRAAGMAGPAVIISWALAAVIALFSALDYAELGASIPEAGGDVVFTQKAMGEKTAFLTGWFVWFGAMVYAALSALGFAAYARIFFPSLHPIAVALVPLLFFFTVNLFGSKETGRTQTLLTIFLVGVLLAISLSSLFHVRPGNYSPLMPKGVFPVIATAGYVYVAYIGFDVITTVSGEVVTAGKVVPRAIILTLLGASFIYLFSVVTMVGVTPYTELAASDTPLAYVASISMGDWGKVLATVGAIVACLSSMNAAMMGSTRYSYALGRYGLFPKSFSRHHPRFGSPYVALAGSTLIILAFICLGDVYFIAYLTDFGYLMALTLVNCSAIIMRRKEPYRFRPFKVPLYPLIPIIAIISAIFLVLTLHWQALAIGGLFSAVGLAVYLLLKLWLRK